MRPPERVLYMISIVLIGHYLVHFFEKRSGSETIWWLLTKSLPLLISCADALLIRGEKLLALYYGVKFLHSIVTAFVFLKPVVKANLLKWLSEVIGLWLERPN